MYRKEIHPHYEQCGKRKKLTGYDGLLFDGDILIHDKEYSTYSQAETALNALVYDLLMDLAERGLSETVPQSGDWIEVEGMRVMAPTDEPPCDALYCTNPATHTINDNSSIYYLCCKHYPDIAGESCSCEAELAALREPPILDDVAQVLDMALGATYGAASVVSELRRVRARIGQVQERATVLG